LLVVLVVLVLFALHAVANLTAHSRHTSFTQVLSPKLEVATKRPLPTTL
jgi:hypothetical protein